MCEHLVVIFEKKIAYNSEMLDNGLCDNLYNIISNPETCSTRCKFKDSDKIHDTVQLDSICTQRFHMVKTALGETFYQGKDLQERRKKY